MHQAREMDWLCRRYQLADQLHVPLSDIDMNEPSQESLAVLADHCQTDVSHLQSLLSEPIDTRWQLIDRHLALPSKTLRCAIASLDGETIDGHFSRCPYMSIYDVSAESYALVSLRQMPKEPGGQGHQQRVDCLNDCQLLFIAAIGGPAAARVIRSDIYPMKVRGIAMIEDTLSDLQQRLVSGSLPPWLKKLMGESWDGPAF
ncbi:MAG: hypothetical protein CENE_02794 [Candidatus Celerinatantimonas neptuna]|nr:MAG: hypothetical protein CENE_02794 [Candidatus Celerinatantimonas neptuna]